MARIKARGQQQTSQRATVRRIGENRKGESVRQRQEVQQRVGGEHQPKMDLRAPPPPPSARLRADALFLGWSGLMGDRSIGTSELTLAFCRDHKGER